MGLVAIEQAGERMRVRSLIVFLLAAIEGALGPVGCAVLHAAHPVSYRTPPRPTPASSHTPAASLASADPTDPAAPADPADSAPPK